MSDMVSPTNPGIDPRQRRASDDAIETLVARAFGIEDGPLFDRRPVSPLLLDEFMRSDDVQRATRDFAAAMVALWKKTYPNKPVLRLALKKIALHAPPDLAINCEALSPPNPITEIAVAMPAKPLIEPAAAPAETRAGTMAAAQPKPADRLHERSARFTLANAKSGEAYDFAIGGIDDSGRPAVVLDARVPTLPAMAFNAATGRLRGIPDQAGEHAVSVQWQDEFGARRSASMVLIVNANPRDLWKTIDADASDPYFKPNQDAQAIAASGRRIAAGSKRGRSHAHAGTCRDDDFFVSHDAASGWSVLLVADGAGSAKSSRKGAQLVSHQAGSHLSSALAGDEGEQLLVASAEWVLDPAAGARRLKEGLYTLFGKAARAGLQAIEDEASAKVAAVKDFSTTLLCAVHRKLESGDFVASFWLGDGAICSYGPGGQAKLMGKPDSGEFAGQTRFLDRAAVNDPAMLWSRIEFTRHDALTALILLTDGISDPRFETDNGLADASKWDAFWAEIGAPLAAADPAQALVDWMDFFTPGHHDDRTIALLW